MPKTVSTPAASSERTRLWAPDMRWSSCSGIVTDLSGRWGDGTGGRPTKNPSGPSWTREGRRAAVTVASGGALRAYDEKVLHASTLVGPGPACQRLGTRVSHPG